MLSVPACAAVRFRAAVSRIGLATCCNNPSTSASCLWTQRGQTREGCLSRVSHGRRANDAAAGGVAILARRVVWRLRRMTEYASMTLSVPTTTAAASRPSKGLTPYEFICKSGASQPERFNLNRGRDAHYCAPPAQNRTCGIPAYGSHLGCLTASSLPYAVQCL